MYEYQVAEVSIQIWEKNIIYEKIMTSAERAKFFSSRRYDVRHFLHICANAPPLSFSAK